MTIKLLQKLIWVEGEGGWVGGLVCVFILLLVVKNENVLCIKKNKKTAVEGFVGWCDDHHLEINFMTPDQWDIGALL